MARKRERDLREQLAAAQEGQRQAVATMQHMQETVAIESTPAYVEFAQEEVGWSELNAINLLSAVNRSELTSIVERSRVYAMFNPLIKRAVRVRSEYVMGRGWQMAHESEDVMTVVDRFTGDPQSRKALFGHQASLERARELDVDGNVFFALFPDSLTGHVRVARLPFEQVVEIIADPDNVDRVWFYRRRWRSGMETREALYPAWDYDPPDRPGVWTDRTPIWWTQSVYQVRTDQSTGDGFGIPDTFAALNWARSYKNFLTQFANIVASLSRFAWNAKTTGNKVASLQTTLQSKIGPGGSAETNPPPVDGSAMVTSGDTELAPIAKTGATVDVESGKPLRLMAGTAMDLPDTIMSGDADQGNRATAQTLDRPTELVLGSRQQVWAQVISDLCTFQIEWAIRVGELRSMGEVTRDREGIKAIVFTDDDLMPYTAPQAKFPSLVEHDLGGLVDSIVKAAKLTGVDPEALLRIVYQTLEVENIDALIEDHRDELDEGPSAPTGGFPQGSDIEELETDEALATLGAVVTQLLESRFGVPLAELTS